jgi:hypothetical protein
MSFSKEHRELLNNHGIPPGIISGTAQKTLLELAKVMLDDAWAATETIDLDELREGLGPMGHVFDDEAMIDALRSQSAIKAVLDAMFHAMAFARIPETARLPDNFAAGLMTAFLSALSFTSSMAVTRDKSIATQAGQSVANMLEVYGSMNPGIHAVAEGTKITLAYLHSPGKLPELLEGYSRERQREIFSRLDEALEWKGRHS